MRLWMIHPKYLDARGLVALWREALLAQAVLRGRTRGYTRHPQLVRFRRSRAPVRCIAAYLAAVQEEGVRRGYAFDAARIARARGRAERLDATRGQLAREWAHLLDKLRRRDPGRFEALKGMRHVVPHPLFRIVRGGAIEGDRGEGEREGREATG